MSSQQHPPSDNATGAPVAVATPAGGAPPAAAAAPRPSIPTRAADLIAALEKTDVATIEAALAATREAYKRGEVAAIETALIEQFALLQSLGLKLLQIAGNEDLLPRIQTFTHLGLRSLDTARKTLATLKTMNEPSSKDRNASQTKN
jgi:hypothetical protein